LFLICHFGRSRAYHLLKGICETRKHAPRK
jgi:hypothetical protein